MVSGKAAVVLVGPPGAGKSTVGALVAQALNTSFFDVDSDIEKRAGKPISEIFIDEGEAHFRQLEQETIAQALAAREGVLSLGGGAVLSADTRLALKDYPVVYLTVEFSDAVTRVGMAADRPVLALNPRATLRHLLNERRPLYEEVATLTVATSGRTPEQVAHDIVRWAKENENDQPN
ncbi:MAG: shikimate kinase [Corynebacteriales bacterium]|nr:shikimate kinase [Mycobacteriales bacterium]